MNTDMTLAVYLLPTIDHWAQERPFSSRVAVAANSALTFLEMARQACYTAVYSVIAVKDLTGDLLFHHSVRRQQARVQAKSRLVNVGRCAQAAIIDTTYGLYTPGRVSKLYQERGIYRTYDKPFRLDWRLIAVGALLQKPAISIYRSCIKWGFCLACHMPTWLMQLSDKTCKAVVSIGDGALLGLPPMSDVTEFYVEAITLFPIIEELVYRVGIQELLLRRLPQKIVPDQYRKYIDSRIAQVTRVVFTSLLFAVSHNHVRTLESGGTLYQFLGGLVYGTLQEVKNDLFARHSIIMHGLWNGCSLAFRFTV